MTSNRAPCLVVGCDRPWKSRDLCQKHYIAWRKANPELVTRYGPRDESLQSKLDRYTRINLDTGCWDTTSWVTGFGYGQIWFRGRFQYLHVLRYGLHVAAVPPKFKVDHLCERRSCSNPRHLEHIPHRINALRGKGHPAIPALKRTECLCWDRDAAECPLHGQLHWRPDWQQCLEDMASRRIYELRDLEVAHA